MKKLFLMMGGAICLSTSVFAYKDIDDRLESLENKMQEISSSNPQKTLGASFGTSQPETHNTRFFGTLEILYWHPKLGGTEYAFTGDYTEASVSMNPLPFPLPSDGDVKSNDLGWDLGIRAGLGYKIPHNHWDVVARYTWYGLNDSSSHQKTYPSNLFSMRSVIAVPCDRVKSHIDIDLNNIELALARSYFLSKNFLVRPHFDAKSTWVDLDQKIHYSISSAPFISEDLKHHETKVSEDCRFWGVGPQAGIDTSLYLGDGFSIIGEVAGSILYGFFKTSMKQDFPITNQDHSISTLNKVKHRFHRFVPFVQIFLGLKWHTYLNNHRQFLQLKAGYEAQYYWSINQMLTTGEVLSNSGGVRQGEQAVNLLGSRTAFTPISEDLSLYGITGEVRLDF